MKSMLFAGCAALAFAAGDAEPQTADDGATVEEVVVTAQKRAENLQDVPVSLTALSARASATGGSPT